MKKLLSLICALCVICGQTLFASNVVFSQTQINSLASNPQITISLPSGNAFLVGSNIVSGSLTLQPTNGVATVSGLAPLVFDVNIDGISGTFVMPVPNDTNTYSAGDLINRGLLLSTKQLALAAGANVTIITNSALGIYTLQIGMNSNLTGLNITDGTFYGAGPGAFSGDGSALKNMSGTNLVNLGSSTYYVATNGNDASAQIGNASLPFKTLYTWSGSGNPTGVLTTASNCSVVVSSGTYNFPACPLGQGIHLIGIGNPTLNRSNSVGMGAIQNDDGNVGPFVQPNNNCIIEGFTIIDNNGTSTSTAGANLTGTYLGAAFGLTDRLTGQNPAGFTNNCIATNWTMRNCTLISQINAVDFRGSTLGVGLTNQGNFYDCQITSGQFTVFMSCLNNAGIEFADYQRMESFGCNFSAGLPYFLNTNAYMGQAACIHTDSIESNNCYFVAHGGIMSLYGTNTTAKIGFIYNERLQAATLDCPTFVLDTNMTMQLPFGSIYYGNSATISQLVSGSYIETNGVYTVLNSAVLAGPGYILQTNSAFAGPTISNGIAMLWNSNATVYFRTSRAGATNYQDTLIATHP